MSFYESQALEGYSASLKRAMGRNSMWYPERKNMSFFANKAVVLKLHKSLVNLEITSTDALNRITVFFTVVTIAKTEHGDKIETSHPSYVTIQGPKKQWMSDTHVTKATKRRALQAVLKTVKDLKPTADFIIAVSKALNY